MKAIKSIKDLKTELERRYEQEVNYDERVYACLLHENLSNEQAKMLRMTFDDSKLRRLLYAGILRAIQVGEDEG